MDDLAPIGLSPAQRAHLVRQLTALEPSLRTQGVAQARAMEVPLDGALRILVLVSALTLAAPGRPLLEVLTEAETRWLWSRLARRTVIPAEVAPSLELVGAREIAGGVLERELTLTLWHGAEGEPPRRRIILWRDALFSYTVGAL